MWGSYVSPHMYGRERLWVFSIHHQSLSPPKLLGDEKTQDALGEGFGGNFPHPSVPQSTVSPKAHHYI